MSTDIDPSYEYPEQNAEGTCSHCGRKTDVNVVVVKGGKTYCCSGCSSAQSLIYSLGLEEYYRIRDFQSHCDSGEDIFNLNTSAEDYSYLNQENFKKLYTSSELPETIRFYIEGIHCTGCLWLIENLATTTDKIESVELNMSTSIATVKVKNDFSVFPTLVSRLGYKAHPVKPDSDAADIESLEGKKLFYRIGIAGFCAGNIMLLSAAVYAGAGSIFKDIFETISAVLILPVVTYCSYPFYMNVINSVKYKKADVDIAVVFIIATGTLLSTVNLLTGGEVYYDSIAAFIFLLLLSRYVLKYLQGRILKQESKNGGLFREQKILKWYPKAGQFFLAHVSEVKPGEKVRFEKGDTVPFDGVCLSRESYLDVSVLTGENYPRVVRSGEIIYAGSRLESDFLSMNVTETGSGTRIGKILKKIEDGSFIKKNLSAFADRYSTAFTFTIASVALVFFSTASYWLSFSDSLTRTISFVLVSCPCAFIFVLPLTYSYSIKSGFDKGFIIRNTAFFDRVRKIKNIFFDKTGTLTKGRFRILKWDYEKLSSKDLSSIAAIQACSNHPIAEAIKSHLPESTLKQQKTDEYGLIPRRGIYGIVNGERYEFINEPLSDINELNQFLLTRINILKDGIEISEILFGDTLRDDAKLTINKVRSMGLKPMVISGDKKENVFKAASKLGVEQSGCYFEYTPEDKIAVLENNPHSIMVGDGLNDSGALTEADIGIAIQGSVEQSLGASDIYLLNKKLSSIIGLINHGIATSGVIRSTVFTSLVYNITAGSFALLGYITPLAAAVLMPSSSFLLMLISYLGHKKLGGLDQC